MMEERKRLAREIHDGLAQTLGFLKLQAAQMKTHLASGEFDRIPKNWNNTIRHSARLIRMHANPSMVCA